MHTDHLAIHEEAAQLRARVCDLEIKLTRLEHKYNREMGHLVTDVIKALEEDLRKIELFIASKSY